MVCTGQHTRFLDPAETGPPANLLSGVRGPQKYHKYPPPCAGLGVRTEIQIVIAKHEHLHLEVEIVEIIRASWPKSYHVQK